MGFFQVRYNSRVVNYNCRGFIKLATGHTASTAIQSHLQQRNTKHEEGRWRTRVLFLILVLVRHDELHCLLQKLSQGASTTTAEAWQLSALDELHELLVVDDVVPVSIDVR